MSKKERKRERKKERKRERESEREREKVSLCVHEVKFVMDNGDKRMVHEIDLQSANVAPTVITVMIQ